MLWQRIRRRRCRQLVFYTSCFIFFLSAFSFWNFHLRSSRTNTQSVDLLIYKAIGPPETPSSAYVLPNEDTSLHVPRNRCNKENGTNVFILFMVTSAPPNDKARNIIRSGFKFFLKDIYDDGFSTEDNSGESAKKKVSELLFFVGNPQDSLGKRRLMNEATLHRDIVIEDLSESYLNLTLKSIRMLKWIERNCDEVNFTVKVDDDAHLNLHRLSEFLKPLLTETRIGRNLVGGKHILSDIPIRDPRSTFGKMYTPITLWPESTFPDYVSGFFYVLGRDARRKIYKEALRRRLFHLEDVFLTGIITSYLRLKVTNLPIISNHWSPFYNLVTTSCDLQQQYLGIRFRDESYLECWNTFNDKKFVCDTWPLFTKCWW